MKESKHPRIYHPPPTCLPVPGMTLTDEPWRRGLKNSEKRGYLLGLILANRLVTPIQKLV